ncbi:hypothetical protein D3C75_935640 [compost metagenome]
MLRRALGDQEAHRFRQHEPEHRQKQQRQDAADDEDRMPIPGRDQPGRDQAADRRAQREAAEHDRHQGRTQAGRAVFTGQGDDVGHGGAQADARDETIDQQLVHRSGEGRQQGEQAEDEGRDQDDGLAAELVRRRAQGEGADRQTQKADGEDRAER